MMGNQSTSEYPYKGSSILPSYFVYVDLSVRGWVIFIIPHSYCEYEPSGVSSQPLPLSLGQSCSLCKVSTTNFWDLETSLSSHFCKSLAFFCSDFSDCPRHEHLPAHHSNYLWLGDLQPGAGLPELFWTKTKGTFSLVAPGFFDSLIRRNSVFCRAVEEECTEERPFVGHFSPLILY